MQFKSLNSFSECNSLIIKPNFSAFFINPSSGVKRTPHYSFCEVPASCEWEQTSLEREGIHPQVCGADLRAILCP